MLRKTALLIVALCFATVAYGKKEAPAGAKNADDNNLVRVLRTPNKAQVNKYVCEALELKNVNPFDVINYFWAVTSREEGGIYSYVNPDGKSGYVVVICPAYQLPTLRKLAADLDRPKLTSAQGSKYIYYRMRHRNIANPNFTKVAAYYIGASGSLVPDVETNSVLIYDAPAGANALEAQFKNDLDTPLQQVEIAVRIYEIDVNNDGTLGLDYEAWKNGPGQVLGQYSAHGEYLNVKGSGHSHFTSSANGVYLNYPSTFFDFLVEKGKAKSLINTKIAALNRVPAELSTGEQIPFYVVKNKDDKRTVTSDIKAVETGISFTVAPIIGEGMINMAMNLKLVNNSGFDGEGQPMLNTRQIDDSIAVAVGDEVIFGGLIRERKIQSTQKVPILGSLPILGYLFGGETTSHKKTIVVTAVSPRLVVDNNNVTAKDDQLVKKASGDVVVTLPESEFCFEQSIPYIH